VYVDLDADDSELALDTLAVGYGVRPPDFLEDCDDDQDELGQGLAPPLQGFEAVRARTDGDLGVAVYRASAGRPVPRLVGFDPGTGAVRWQESVDPEGERSLRLDSDPHRTDALGGGRFFMGYEPASSDSMRLTAFDARTGQRLWDIELEERELIEHFEALVVAGERLFVARGSYLEIRDVEDGDVEATIGRTSYSSRTL